MAQFQSRTSNLSNWIQIQTHTLVPRHLWFPPNSIGMTFPHVFRHHAMRIGSTVLHEGDGGGDGGDGGSDVVRSAYSYDTHFDHALIIE